MYGEGSAMLITRFTLATPSNALTMGYRVRQDEKIILHDLLVILKHLLQNYYKKCLLITGINCMYAFT